MVSYGIGKLLVQLLVTLVGIPWTSSAGVCGPSTLQASPSGLDLKFPNSLSKYPPSTTCTWTITAAATGYVVRLIFKAFDIHGNFYLRSNGCSDFSNDRLEIYDGSQRLDSKLLGRYCGNALPPNVYSSDRTLFLRFISDGSIENAGFNLTYKAVFREPDRTICSPFNAFYQNNAIEHTGSSGYIESPLYGSKYPSNMQCTWVITIPKGKIKLTFSDFSVGTYYYTGCTKAHDYLQIRDGQYSYSLYLKALCGSTKPSPVYSTGRHMWIHFQSNSDNYLDDNHKTNGFKAKYEAEVEICNRPLLELQASPSASNLTFPISLFKYPPSTSCNWTITAPRGHIVELKFIHFETEGSISWRNNGCSSFGDLLEIYDGSQELESKLLGRYCANSLPPNVYSSGATLFLRFKSDKYTEKEGFDLKYKSVLSNPDPTICSPFNTFSQNNAIMYTESSGYIESPLYGSKYPSNMQCTWAITVPQGKIKLTFSDFSLGMYSITAGCTKYQDYLEIRDGKYPSSRLIKSPCSNTKPSPVYSTGRHMWIRFQSNSDNYLGDNHKTNRFKAKYEAEVENVTGLIVGVIIAIVVVIVIIVSCIYIKKRRSPGHGHMPQTTVTYDNQNPTSATPQYPQQMGSGGASYPHVIYSPAPQGSCPPPSSEYTPPQQGGYQEPPMEVAPDASPPPYPGKSQNPSQVPLVQQPPAL